jgi:molecular chaperone DnaK
MVKEAEASKEADKKRRELIDLKNESDTMAYNTEKQLQEHNARIPDSVKTQVRGDITKLNESITTDDPAKIREALERLKNSSMEIGKAIYSQ